MKHNTRYALIGFLVSKLVVPVVKRQARAKTRRAAAGAVQGVRSHPARTSIVVGATVGAAGWLLTRSRGSETGES